MQMSKHRDSLTVDLVSASNPQHRRGFELRHAERILRIPQSGWELPQDSQYVFNDGYLSKKPKKQDEQ